MIERGGGDKGEIKEKEDREERRWEEGEEKRKDIGEGRARRQIQTVWGSFTNNLRSLRCVCLCEFGNLVVYATSSLCVVFIKPDTHQAISAYSALKRN